ncbi:UreF-domain-containing protein [Chytriomyces sp. MP71]|nr:UreF-domain-containing protein [Chytriomyces sp. MP71]
MQNCQWVLLLLGDSALPTGGFVASSGLEAYASVFKPSKRDLVAFVEDNVLAYAAAALPYLSQAHSVIADCTEQQMTTIAELDDSFESLLASNVPARRASKAQGSALVSLIDRAFPDSDPVFLAIARRFRIRIREGTTQGHHPLLFSLLCATLRVPLPATQELFLFCHARALVSAAVRLNLWGPYEGQREMLSLQPVVARVLKRVRARMVEAVQTGVMVELVQGLHDRLYSRLFNS